MSRAAHARVRHRVSHLTSVHPPWDVRIVHKECASLAGAGYDVTLVVGRDQAPPREVPIKVIRVPEERHRLKRMTLTVWRIYREARKLPASVYHLHDPELLPAGILLALSGSRVIFDAHESLRRQVMGKVWLPKYLRPLVALAAVGIEWLAGRLFSAIVAATPAIARDFPQSKTVIVQNFPMLPREESHPAKPYSERPNTVVYVGLITRGRGAAEMIDAIACVPGNRNARLLLIGPFGPPQVREEMSRRPGWDLTTAMGWTAPHTARELMSACRIGLVLFRPEPNNVESYPTKMFEYMAAGLPIVASNFPLWREIVEEAGCGILVDPTDPTAIGRAITELLDNPSRAEEMGNRGRIAVQEQYSWRSEQKKLLDLYSRLLSTSTADQA